MPPLWVLHSSSVSLVCTRAASAEQNTTRRPAHQANATHKRPLAAPAHRIPALRTAPTPDQTREWPQCGEIRSLIVPLHAVEVRYRTKKKKTNSPPTNPSPLRLRQQTPRHREVYVPVLVEAGVEVVHEMHVPLLLGRSLHASIRRHFARVVERAGRRVGVA